MDTYVFARVYMCVCMSAARIAVRIYTYIYMCIQHSRLYIGLGVISHTVHQS